MTYVMTQQEIYDAGLKHMRKQGDRSVIVTKGGQKICQYRAPNGDTCIVGGMIRDEEYSPVLEGRSIDAILDFNEFKFPSIVNPANIIGNPKFQDFITRVGSPENVSLLRTMQIAHDQSRPCLDRTYMDSFEEAMKAIAERFGLIYSPPPDMTTADILALPVAKEGVPHG